MHQPNLPVRFTPQFLWEEVRQQIWEGLDSDSKNEAQSLASLYTPMIYKSVRSGMLPLIWELQDSPLVPPKDFGECQAFSLSIATWQEFIFETYLGIKASIATKVLEEKLYSLLPKLEHYGELSERYWEQITDWLNTRLRSFAGSLSELYFGRYKRYHPLPSYKQHLLLDKLEKASEGAALRSLYKAVSDLSLLSNSLPDFFQRFEEGLETISSEFNFPDSPSLEGFVNLTSFSADILLEFIFRISFQLADSRSRIREEAEESIRSSIQEACKRLVEEVERYDLHWDERRLEDHHIRIIQFNPLDALCWSIILEYKEKKHSVHKCSLGELAKRNGIDVRLIYNFSRRIKYYAKVNLLN